MTLASGSILVVDENKDVSHKLSAWLEPQGYSVVIPESKHQLRDVIRAQPFDLVLLNLAMLPAGDPPLLEQIKADPALHHPGVIIMADADELDRVLDCIELGAQDYLFKPFNKTLVQTRIANSLAQKRLREQAQFYETALKAAKIAQSKFVSFVSHELRTPLTSIKGYAELLKSGTLGPVNESQLNFLTTIIANANRMAGLLTNLNDISRLEAQRLRVEFAMVNLGEVMGKVISSFQPKIAQKEQNLTVQIPEDLPPVWADPDRLKQILTSLLNNAHKYTPPGGHIVLTVEHTANRWDPQGAPTVNHVSVQDNGIGIRSEDQAKIFEKFFRSEEPAVRDVAGAGLGLHLSKRLVEIQGGCIWFESEYGQGSNFHFTVPNTPAEK